jgi:hypothetical protein
MFEATSASCFGSGNRVPFQQTRLSALAGCSERAKHANSKQEMSNKGVLREP